MNHLSEDQLYQYAMDLAALSTTDAGHLASCDQCRQELIKVRRFLQELAVATHSRPNKQLLERYNSYFEAVRQGAQLAAATPWLRPTLRWDGRQQPALRGVRNILSRGYRLLYVAAQAEVEMMIAPQGAHFTVDGEIYANDASHSLTPALVQLQMANPSSLLYETESTGSGRFHLDSVAAGAYVLSITPPTGAFFEIEELEIS